MHSQIARAPTHAKESHAEPGVAVKGAGTAVGVSQSAPYLLARGVLPSLRLSPSVGAQGATAPVAGPAIQRQLSPIEGFEPYYDDSRAYGFAFIHMGSNQFQSTDDDVVYTYSFFTHQYWDPSTGSYFDPSTRGRFMPSGFGNYTGQDGKAYTYSNGHYVPIQSPSPLASVAPTPSPVVTGGSSDSATPATPSGGPSRRPQYVAKARPGKSTHFPAKLPPRLTRKAAEAQYEGAGKERFKGIYKQAERSSLSESLTKRLRQDARDRLGQGHPVTPEARAMAASSSPSLSESDTQRNHIFAAESTLLAMSAAVAPLVTHGTTDDERTGARRRAGQVARALTNDDAVVGEVEMILAEVDSDVDDEAAAEVVSRVTRMTADHRHNVDLGHAGRNASMSNRTDVTTNADRTEMAERDAAILDGLASPVRALVGSPLRDSLLAVPVSPGGQHILSSKTLEEEEDEDDSL